MDNSEKTMLVGVFLNIILFLAKIVVGVLSNSLSLLSDAFNSLTDIVSYTGIFLAVKISNKSVDTDHQYGHRRAEPIAGLIIAVFAIILGVEIVKNAYSGLVSPRTYSHEAAAVAVLLFTMAVKAGMSLYFTRIGTRTNRPAIRAAGIDSRNDILVSGIALTGVVGPYMGIAVLDSIAALFISIFVFYSAYKIGKENIDYLMGKCPPKEYILEIKDAVKKVNGVKGINTVKAHYVGNHIHVEIHIEVDKDSSTLISHKIGKDAQREVERFDYVDHAFIHIDPR